MYTKEIHYSQDFEYAILGICLLEKSAFARVYSLVKEDHFYYDSTKQVFISMKYLYENGAPIDMLTVADDLYRRRGVSTISNWGVGFLIMQMTNAVVSSLHLEYWCHCIHAMWIEREIIRLTYSGPPKGHLKQQVADLMSKLTILQSQDFEKDWYDMTDLMIMLYTHREEMQKKGGIGIPTGIKTIDKANGGLGKGQMISIGARPSVGKSAFIGGLAVNVARQGHKVGIISLEMNNVEIANRLASIDTDTDFNILFRGLQIDQQQAENLYYKIGQQTAKLPIWVSDKTKVNILDIKTKALKLKHQHGLDLLIIDYLQLVDSMNDGNKNRNRENEVSAMSRGIKLMAKELDIPVIVLCQLNRQVVHRKGQDRFPQLSDFRESGSIEQDSDIVMFLHRDWLNGITADEQGNSTERQAHLVIRKWRNGTSNFIVDMDFEPSKMNFKERPAMGQWAPVPVRIERNDRIETNEDDENPF